jgi:hypothetical protein
MAAAILVQEIVHLDERHSDKITATQVLARLNERARELAKAEARREATIQQIVHLMSECGLRTTSGDNGELYDFTARVLMSHFKIEPEEEQLPF